MRRRLFSALSVLSLLMCAATAVMWGLGVWWQAHLECTIVRVHGSNWLQRHRRLSLYSGDLVWQADDILGQDQQLIPEPERWHFTFVDRDASDRMLGRLRPRWISRKRTLTPGQREIGVVRYQEIGIPYWCLIGITAILPIAWLLVGYRRRWRTATNRCAACGYNLTGNTSGVCPECGTPAAAGVKA